MQARHQALRGRGGVIQQVCVEPWVAKELVRAVDGCRDAIRVEQDSCSGWDLTMERAVLLEFQQTQQRAARPASISAFMPGGSAIVLEHRGKRAH